MALRPPLPLTLTLFGLLLAGPAAAETGPPGSVSMLAWPEALVADGVPPIAADLAERVAPWLEQRSATFLGFDTAGDGILVSTRFADVAQVHAVATPLGMRRQLTFGTEPVRTARAAPAGDPLIVFSRDRGGDEFFQLYALDPAGGQPALLTDGQSRNEFGVWSRDGARIAYSSTRRTGRDTDIWVCDPRRPGTERLVLERTGGGWSAEDFSPDGRSLLVLQYVSITDARVHLLDLATGSARQISADDGAPVAYAEPRFAPDGTIHVLTDRGSDVRQLATLDPETGETRVLFGSNWDVEQYDIAPRGDRIAISTNEAGISLIRVLSSEGAELLRPDLPVGVVTGLRFSRDGSRLGFALSEARTPYDAFTVDVATGALTRWTASETGGLDTSEFVEPELVEVRSFDGERVSGFLYRPDPARFPGPRPLVISIHGGPEAQSRPAYLNRNAYLPNGLGIALFYPNVRGSSGYGKRFLTLDNGRLRENAVQDIGAFLDRLAADPAIDAGRIGVTGGSYGGYMTYATMIRYGDRLRAGLSVVGISDFVTFLTNTQGYRQDLRRVEYGDERDPEMNRFLKSISPLGRAADLRIPLFTVTGLNDPRVPASEAEQMIAAVRANGGEAWHLLARDEGHGFAKKANADAQFLATLQFWDRFLLVEGPR